MQTVFFQIGAGFPLVGMLIALVVFVLLFILLREVNTWYWKINERTKLQQRTNELLEQMLYELKSTRVPSAGSLNAPRTTNSTTQPGAPILPTATDFASPSDAPRPAPAEYRPAKPNESTLPMMDLSTGEIVVITQSQANASNRHHRPLTQPELAEWAAKQKAF